MRKDIHRPSEIIPENYQFVAFDYIGGSDLGAIMALKVEREAFNAHQLVTGGRYSSHEHGGSCFVCGAYASYLCIFHHALSNTYIKTGEDCARKLDMSYGDSNLFRRAIADAREAQAGKKKAIAILSEAGLMQAWDMYINPSDYLKDNPRASGSQEECGTKFIPYEESTIQEMVSKLVKYGSFSEKQVSFLRILLDRVSKRPVIEAQRAAEHEVAALCPTGRLRITGTVVGTKTVPDYYSRHGGEMTKIIVKDSSGFKVYGSQFERVQRGDSVDFVATVTPSPDDSKFGFFKHPAPYVDKILVKLMKTVAWG